MTDHPTSGNHAVLIEPATLKIERRLPGPIERVWAYLTESDLRRQWLAAGEMEMRVGATFELVWHNDELTDPPGRRPPQHAAHHRMQSRITELDPPRRLAFTWDGTDGVSFELAQHGDEVLLTLLHHRVLDREILRSVSAGWHIHLDILVARAAGREPEPFWDGYRRLKEEYDRRLPG